jgi:hypothetical protein
MLSIWEFTIPLRIGRIANKKGFIRKIWYQISLFSPFVILGIILFGFAIFRYYPETVTKTSFAIYIIILITTGIFFQYYRIFVFSKTLTSLQINRKANYKEYRKNIGRLLSFPFSIYKMNKSILEIINENKPSG